MPMNLVPNWIPKRITKHEQVVAYQQ